MTNKHVDDSKKAVRAGKRIFSDLMTNKTPQDSNITMTNRIHVDQFIGYKK